MRPEYSVWLLPEAMQENALAQTIVSLATRLGESAFAPHVTIQGDLFQSPQQLAASLSRLAAETPVQRWRVQRIECSRHFFRCLFLRFAHETVFERLQSEVEACTRTREGLSPYPHLSLAYGPLRPETLKQRDELASAFVTREIAFDRLAVCRSSKDIPITDWSIVAQYPLTGH